MTKPTKKWEVFPGRNKFYCDGRVMMAPHTGVFYITVLLIVATSILFFVFDCPFLAVRVSPFIPAVSGLLFVFTLSALLRTSFSDPGVIPRASAEEAALYDKQIEVGNSSSPTYRPPPRTKEIMVRGQPVKLKYCFTCKIFRPPRASHCSLCDNCVDRFDHHCPWVGNCVGRRNYRYFYMFIVSLAFLCVFMFACVVTHLVMVTRDVPFLDAVKDSPASVVVAVVCFFSVWSVLGLAGFHTYLASSNQTTNEDIKGSFSSKRGIEGRNPYSEGNVCSNCFHVLCGPVPPSLLDRRGDVTAEMLEELKKVKNPNIPTLYGTARTPTQNGGVFPALQDTCGTPNPLQQQCKTGNTSHTQTNGKSPPTPASTASGVLNGELPKMTAPKLQSPVEQPRPPPPPPAPPAPVKVTPRPHQPPCHQGPHFANSVQDFRALQLCPAPEYAFSNLQPRTTEKGILEPAAGSCEQRSLYYPSYRKIRKPRPELHSPDERTHLGGAFTLPRKNLTYAKQDVTMHYPRYCTAHPYVHTYNFPQPVPRAFIAGHNCFVRGTHPGDQYKTLLLPFQITDTVANHAIERRNLVEKERLRIEVEFGNDRRMSSRGDLYIPPLPPVLTDINAERRVSRGELYIPPLPPIITSETERRMSRGELYAPPRRLGDEYNG